MFTDQHCSIAGISAKWLGIPSVGQDKGQRARKKYMILTRSLKRTKSEVIQKKIDLFSLSMLV